MQINATPYIVDLASTEALPKESGNSRPVQAERGSRQKSFDHVEISSGSLSLEQLKNDLAALPDVRLDRVALARQTLQDGGYRVDASVLAEKMMQAFGA